LGLVQSFNRPSGNITGVTFLVNTLGAKRLELLHELFPKSPAIGFLTNPTSPNSVPELNDVQSAAFAVGQKIFLQEASMEGQIAEAFDVFARERISGVIISADPYFLSRVDQMAELSIRHSLPVMHYAREFPEAGGLMSYGASIPDAHRLAGVYAGRILKGEKVADLPIQQSTKVELIINLRAAKTMGLTFPLPLLGRADEVIE
jgi:putative ABC transport system substrate-binding protein